MMEWQHQSSPKECRPNLANSLAIRTAYGPGQLIYDEGQPIECWYRIVSGMARRFTVRPEGKRQIVDLLLPGDAFGFGARDRHAFAAQAIGDGTVVARYSRARLHALARSDSNLAQELQAMALEECQRLQDLIVIIGQTRAREKVEPLCCSWLNASLATRRIKWCCRSHDTTWPTICPFPSRQ
jgi:CRP-like cAMP-binding protein